MKKHIFASILTLLTLFALAYVFSIDKDIHAIDRAEYIIEKSKISVDIKKPIRINVEQNEQDEKLKSLSQKAGNISHVKVSKLYKSKCASCHGIDGSGGVGLNIAGLEYSYIKKSLFEFKSGVKKNYVMYGLLQNLNDEQIEILSQEISKFAKINKKK